MVLEKVIEVKYMFDNANECAEIRDAIEQQGYEILICNLETENPYLVARKKCM